LESLRRIAWVERLTVLHVMVFLFRSLFSRFQVRFNEHSVSRFALLILGAMKKAGWAGGFIPAGLVLNLMDEKGYAVDYQRADDLAAAVELFCGSQMGEEPDWMRKMTASYLSSFLDQRVTFVTMVRRRMSEMAGRTHEIYPANHFANYILKSYYRTQGLTLKQFVPLTSFLRQSLKPLRLLMRAVLAGWRRDPVFGDLKRGAEENSLWIEYEPLHGVWKGFRAFLSARRAAYPVVYYLDRTDTPVTPETTSNLEGMGFRWIDLHGFRNACLTVQDAAGILRDLFGSARLSDPLWLTLFRLDFRVTRRLYLDLFQTFSVKALIQHQEVSWMQEAQAQALSEAGGVMLGLHWSNYLNYVYPTHLTPQHVFFVWGEAHLDLLRKKGNTIDHILPSGLWIKEGPGAAPPIDLSAQVTFTISVFDDNAAYDLYQSPETVSRFYAGIVEVLEEDPCLGAVIKSKTYEMDDLAAFPGGADMVRRMRALVAGKRMIFLDHREYSPIVAAKRSNLAVCCGINSAGIIAGLHGCRVVCWDCTGWLKFPISRDGEQRVIYGSVNDMKAAIKMSARGDDSIGDLSRWRRKINYFDDAAGQDRICDFIDTFMASLSNSRDRLSSIENAVARYKTKYDVPEDFRSSGNWWN
jgi:hypothetical protein